VAAGAAVPACIAGGTGADVQLRVNSKIVKESVMRMFFTGEPPSYGINGDYHITAYGL
jgi:hypothetical protein